MSDRARGQALFHRSGLSYDIQLALDASGRVRNLQLRPRTPHPVASSSAASEWSPHFLHAPVQDAHAIPVILLGTKGVPFPGQPEVTEKQAIAAAAAAAAVSAGGSREEAEQAAANAAHAADNEQAAAAPEGLFQK